MGKLLMHLRRMLRGERRMHPRSDPQQGEIVRQQRDIAERAAQKFGGQPEDYLPVLRVRALETELRGRRAR